MVPLRPLSVHPQVPEPHSVAAPKALGVAHGPSCLNHGHRIEIWPLVKALKVG